MGDPTQGISSKYFVVSFAVLCPCTVNPEPCQVEYLKAHKGEYEPEVKAGVDFSHDGTSGKLIYDWKVYMQDLQVCARPCPPPLPLPCTH